MTPSTTSERLAYELGHEDGSQLSMRRVFKSNVSQRFYDAGYEQGEAEFSLSAMLNAHRLESMLNGHKAQ